ncbi:hypothetical protein GQ44DRAFT_760970 [Phaeosphaeriaceae sp. PMI808]|nr:hypothetical protein GQ44DRAFT_760970 [Phaeosphaeriaceae sp. PMI808]
MSFITYSMAVADDVNVLRRIEITQKNNDFMLRLAGHTADIKAIVSHHLPLMRGESCVVSQPDQWITGGFNVCIPVEIPNGTASRKVLLRCPLPQSLAEREYPGSISEKMRCEVATCLFY